MHLHDSGAQKVQQSAKGKCVIAGTTGTGTVGTFLGINTTTPAYTLDVVGNVNITQALILSGSLTSLSDISTTGTLEAAVKSFVIPHPTKPGKKLKYGVLEGPEHAVYYRGITTTGTIDLPEEWTGLVAEDSITVQLTSIGSHQNLYVSEIKDNTIFIKNGNTFSSKINAYYLVHGTRKDVDKLKTVV